MSSKTSASASVLRSNIHSCSCSRTRVSSSTSASAGGNAAGAPRLIGKAYSYEALYQDIVPAERIVYTYDMQLEETRISVSLATVELRPVSDNGTRLIFTEQG